MELRHLDLEVRSGRSLHDVARTNDRLAGLSNADVELVRRCQPFTSPDLEPLKRVRDLSIADRHHALLLTAWAPDIGDSRLVHVSGCDQAEPHYLVGMPLAKGMAIVRVKLWNPRPPLRLEMVYDWRPFIAFAGGRADRDLERAAGAVEATLGRLEALFL